MHENNFEQNVTYHKFFMNALRNIIHYNYVQNVFPDLLEGKVPPKSRANLNDESFRSWDDATYLASSLNIVTVTKGYSDNRKRYSGTGRVRSRGIRKTTDNPSGFTEEDHKLILCCTCAEWSRTALACLHCLIVLHLMGKLDVFAENASLAVVGKQGRRKHRGLAFDREMIEKSTSYPSKYPAGIVYKTVRVPNHSGMGMITGE